jgi:hypothetical protein
MVKLFLYTTLGCHLCEQAEAILKPLLENSDYQLTLIEIADSDALIERYGIRIPVLQRDDNQSELGWPFDADAVNAFLSAS